MNEIAAPKPEVVHLPTLFRRIRNGAIRVPAFQREFVWKEDQILALLASVFQGFPIGSVLLWRVERELLRVQTSDVTAFPDLPLSFPLDFVLDGMQRLSTLYGVCNYEGGLDQEDKFNVVFDLKADEFVHYDADELPEVFVPLSSLFSPKRLMELQIELVSRQNANEYLDKIVNLHSRFQEYLIPTVTIEEQDVSKVVNIFERVNNTGTKLSSVDFMRAVTWSDNFDLTWQIRRLQQAFKELNFDIQDDTIVKALGIVNDLDPLPDVLLSLREFSSARLRESITAVDEGLKRVFEFVGRHFHIKGSDYIPYEGQILVLFKALTSFNTLSESQQALLQKWFWTTGFNEALRGKPDNFVARTINAVVPALEESRSSFGKRLQVEAFDFRSRRFIRSKALSATLATMFAKNGARSLVTGELIPPEDYMIRWDQRSFVPVISAEALKLMSSEEMISGRLLSNIIVASQEDVRFFAQTDPATHIIDNADNEDYGRILASQYIDGRSIDRLNDFDAEGFLDLRAEILYGGASDIIGQLDMLSV